MTTNAPVPSFIERLERQSGEAVSTIDAVLQRATDEDRDLTETEEATLTDARERMQRADTQRAEWVGLLESRAASDELGTRAHGALARSSLVGDRGDRYSAGGLVIADPEEEMRRLFRGGPGDYVQTYIRAQQGDQECTARLQRAVANQTVPDNLGIVPTPILGPVINLISGARPTVASANNRALPAGGRTFTRPLVSQHTNAGVQATEKTELVSRTMKIDPLTVTKSTYGGTLDISFQDRDWTEPAILQIVIDDLAIMYARQTDQAFCTAFHGLGVSSVTALTPDGPGLLAAVTEAASAIQMAVNLFPDTVWMSPDVWAQVAAMTDTIGRPLFSILGGDPAPGSGMSAGNYNGNIYGLRVVVDMFLPAATMIVGVSSLAEFYEQIGGQLSITEPSILGFVIAYYGYVAWCFPSTGAFVKIVVPPPVGGLTRAEPAATSSK